MSVLLGFNFILSHFPQEDDETFMFSEKNGNMISLTRETKTLTSNGILLHIAKFFQATCTSVSPPLFAFYVSLQSHKLHRETHGDLVTVRFMRKLDSKGIFSIAYSMYR